MRPHGSGHQPSNSTTSIPAGQIPGYFDANGIPIYTKRDTVGSASATDSRGIEGLESGFGSAAGSVGARTAQWDVASNDGMSIDTNREARVPSTYLGEADELRDVDDHDERLSALNATSDDDMSDGDASLVGFGEGAGSTVSGPTYTKAIGEKDDATGAETTQRIIRERLEQDEISGGRAMSTPENVQNLGKLPVEEKK